MAGKISYLINTKSLQDMREMSMDIKIIINIIVKAELRI